MSERYIFNQKLNQTNKRWYWIIVSLVTFWAFNSMAQEEQVALVDPAPSQSNMFTSELQDVQYKRLPSGGAQAILIFDNDKFQMQLSETDKSLVLLLPATKLGNEQLFKLDVVDFATPVNMIETFQAEDNTRVEFNLQEIVSFRHQKSSNSLMIEIDKVSVEQLEAREKDSEYDGEPISLDFQDVPVRQVLQIIAQVNGFNLVTTDTVRGNVTISLSGVPWDQALAMILKIKGLDNVLRATYC